MKKKILIAILLIIGLSGCAGPHGGRGCMSTVNNWYKDGKTRYQTSQELVYCSLRCGTICNGAIIEECMFQKGFICVDGTENPRDLNKTE